MYIKELTNFFNLELLLNNKKWELLSFDEKTSISRKWSDLTSSARKSKLNSISISNMLNKIHLGIVKNIILHYESYISNWNNTIFTEQIYNEDEDKIYDKDKKQLISNDYSVNIKNNENITAEEFIKLVNEKYTIDIIYNYLIIVINEFNKTWFGKRIIKDNKIIELDIKLSNIKSTNTYYLTYKNIYNFAKRLCYNNFKYITEARCLNDENLSKFVQNINDVQVFPNVLKLTYEETYSTIDISDILTNISFEIKKILMDIVFESHIIYGLLCKFKPKSEVTSNYYQSNFTNNIQTIIFNDNNVRDFKDSYYFLTNDKYEKLSYYQNNKIINYIDMLKTMNWYTLFALDWIYQIQFYHRFLNNRLIYVTGATGQGKSTQIPKLLYYATKAFCLVMNPKVISTQPRIIPTKDNANTISYQMGVPIEVEVNKDNNTFLDYIQYNTKEYKHKYDSKTYIREVIDKILYDELLKDPLLDDIYNVIIVDEAHEHNINMDLILTLMKSTLYFNNKIRFVITSATIDDDESTYRTYYRHIDDNLLFPCNLNLLDKLNELDRIVIDRRTHISPPGETTRFKVIEEWEEKDPRNYKEAEEIGIKRALEIAKINNGQGDILFFSIGSTEIKRICKQLNDILPSYAIALPFFRELPEEWKLIAKKPSERINKLNFDKKKLFDIINGEKYENIKIVYSTVFIVSTNIAEASITIDNLKFVIDTGFNKYIPFDIINNKKEIKEMPITNMNRIQRKGRVGRQSDGTIYYTYSKNYLNDKKPNYSIKNTDFTINIYKLLTSEEDYIDEIAIDETKLIMKTKKKYFEFDDDDDYYNSIHNKKKYFFKDNYTIDKKWFNPKGNKKIRNFDVLKVPRRYIDGKFSFKDIKDEENEFYLIHPDKIDAYYQNCKIKKYILTRDDKKDIKNEYTQKILDVTIYFGEIFGQNEDETIPIINTLIHSIKYDCLDNVVKILIWLYIIKLEPFKICNKGKRIEEKSSSSDLLVLLNLENMFAFDHEITIKDITPAKEDLQLFIDWMNDTDNNKWFKIPNEYKKIYEYIFNKNTELGELQFNLKFQNLNGIIKDDKIKEYIEKYKKMKFSFNEEYIDNELLKNNKLVSGYKKIKELADEITINKTDDNNINIVKSFFSGYNNIILSCNNNNWINN